jgi:hypothetical protein
MKLVRAFCCLAALVGFCALVARADDTASDPVITMHEPDPAACPTGAYCINLTYEGPTTLFGDILFATVPASGLPATIVPPPPTYSCDTNAPLAVFIAQYSDVSAPPPPITGDFVGCLYLGLLTTGETFTLSADGGPIVLSNPNTEDWVCQDAAQCSDGDLDLTPEPGTGVLFASGLLLLSLAGFARKRFGATVVT